MSKMPSVQVWVWKLKPHPYFLFLSSVSLLYSLHPSPRSNMVSTVVRNPSLLRKLGHPVWTHVVRLKACVWEIKLSAKLETTEFLGHLTSDNKKPEIMESDSCHDTKAPNNNPPAVKRGLRVHVRERQTEKDRMTCNCVYLAVQHPQAVLKKWFNNKDGLGPRWREFGPVDRTVTCSVGQLLHCHYVLRSLLRLF